jgi:hypothetical protein
MEITMLLKDVKINWPRLGSNPGTKYASDETEWSVDCEVKEDESREWVKNGYAMKERFNPESSKPYVKVKRNTHYNKKNVSTGVMEKHEISAPFVKDKYGDEMDPSNIGNGSVCNVQYMIREWEYQGKKGKTPTLVGIQVTDLVEYSGAAPTDEFSYEARPEVTIGADEEHLPF